MTLYIDKRDKYADIYDTNWSYLHNMTSLQLKALEEMKWHEDSKYIHTELWVVPLAWIDEKSTKHSVGGFMERLNEKMMEL